MANTPASPGEPKKSNAGDLLVQGSILAIAGILVRFIGLLYKVPMIRILGQEGMGYYNTAYEIYNIGLILSSYSLPLAMSKLIAARRVRKRYQDIQRVYASGMMFSALPYTPQEIENAHHQYELPPKVKTVVRCAKGQLGLGGENTWGAKPHPEYHLALAKNETFAFCFGGMGGQGQA